MVRLVLPSRRLRRVVPRLLLACAIVVPLGQRAVATEHGPICRVRSVVDVMAREIRRHDHYARVEKQQISEYPAVTPNVVLCAVPAWTLRYDAWRNGNLPLVYPERYEFRVQALLGGYVVKLLP